MGLTHSTCPKRVGKLDSYADKGPDVALEAVSAEGEPSSQRALNQLLARVRRLVAFFKSSPKQTSRMSEVGGKKHVTMCVTRWDTYHDVVSRFLENRPSLEAYVEKYGEGDSGIREAASF